MPEDLSTKKVRWREGDAMTLAGVDWGNAPSWAAFGTALVAARYAIMAYRREDRRDQVTSELRLREQANKVAGWLEQREVVQENPLNHMLSTVKQVDFLIIRNSSDLPVAEVCADLVLLRSRNVLHSETRAVAPPGELVIRVPQPAVSRCEVRLTFTDAQGITWERWQGKLDVSSAPGVTQPKWWAAFEYVPGSLLRETGGAIIDMWRNMIGILREVGAAFTDMLGSFRRRR